ncbi:S-methyl-5-thioribose-1-phosphate isomerase [Tieghemiomyces parasiticus]|uniref:Methylthioribose-1-phosphate isomerase n=1 Tax=Tieghemiomyces parasiticus TaxID=78921 RepID=A0A9W7ZLM7_9FUNG|nr:S-methyl-5-thioribose-1-phosphate isomerase [Tieghemiomyces parasiticus]
MASPATSIGNVACKPSALQAIVFEAPRQLQILDQLLLPFESVYVPIRNLEDGHRAIRTMQVRGAPAIAIVGVLALVVDALNSNRPVAPTAVGPFLTYIDDSIKYLLTSRPTAVNLFEATNRLTRHLENVAAAGTDVDGLKAALLAYGEAMLTQDIKDNRRIGRYGAEYILSGGHTPVHDGNQADPARSWSVLTHCNTGALATAGWGTALGIIRSLHAAVNSDNEHGHFQAYCTETRPYLQGSRLTAYELVHDGIPATLITDSMVSALLATHRIDAVVVGADRVTANGDTANKIGTYQLAIAARYHGVPMIVAAPTTSIDLGRRSGAEIEIEERPQEELLAVTGRVTLCGTPEAQGEEENVDASLPATTKYRMPLAAPGIQAWNPSFDVTPAALIDAIVTELGVVTKNAQGEFDLAGFIQTRRAE